MEIWGGLISVEKIYAAKSSSEGGGSHPETRSLYRRLPGKYRASGHSLHHIELV